MSVNRDFVGRNNDNNNNAYRGLAGDGSNTRNVSIYHAEQTNDDSPALTPSTRQLSINTPRQAATTRTEQEMKTERAHKKQTCVYIDVCIRLSPLSGLCRCSRLRAK